MDNKTPGFYDIVRLCKGGLALRLPAFDASSNDKTVNIDWNVQKVRVPRQFALGIFTDSTLERMYKQGYFKVEPVAQFEKEVAEIFFPVEDKVEAISEDKILTALTKGDRVTVKKIIADGGANKDKVIIIARENIGNLSSSMIRDLEKILGVELEVENEVE